MRPRGGTRVEERTARLTILIDPRKKAMLEQLCAAEDVTPSQLVRKLIRGYIEQRLGRPWLPPPRPESGRNTQGAGAVAKRRSGARGFSAASRSRARTPPG